MQSSPFCSLPSVEEFSCRSKGNVRFKHADWWTEALKTAGFGKTCNFLHFKHGYFPEGFLPAKESSNLLPRLTQPTTNQAGKNAANAAIRDAVLSYKIDRRSFTN